MIVVDIDNWNFIKYFENVIPKATNGQNIFNERVVPTIH